MGDSRIKDVSSLLSAFFDEEKRRRGGLYSDFFGSWRQIAGERLAVHSRVRDIENGILIVEAEHPGWIQLLQLKQAQMLAEAVRLFPELGLRGISFRLRGDRAAGDPARDVEGGNTRPGPFGPGARAPAEGPREEETPANAPGGAATLDEISDPALRALLGELKRTVEGNE